MDKKKHWETIYQTKDVHTVSWFQVDARESLDLITRYAPDRTAPIIDVGGGASVLVDDLLSAGYTDLTVLDVSETGARDIATATRRRRRQSEVDCRRCPGRTSART